MMQVYFNVIFNACINLHFDILNNILSIYEYIKQGQIKKKRMKKIIFGSRIYI